MAKRATDPSIDIWVNNKFSYRKMPSGLELAFLDLRPPSDRLNFVDYTLLTDTTPPVLTSWYPRTNRNTMLRKIGSQPVITLPNDIHDILLHPEKEELEIETPTLWYKTKATYEYPDGLQFVTSIEQRLRFGDGMDCIIEPPPTTLERLRQMIHGLFQIYP